MGNKSKVAVAALVMGCVSFLNLLGVEKAMAAIIFGWMGLEEAKQEQKAGKKLAYAGILLGFAYIVTVTVLLVIYGPEFMTHVKTMSGK